MSRVVRLRAVLLLGAISTFLLAGWYPYEVRSPLRDNGAERLNDGILRFGAPGIARTETPPEWLKEATLSNRLVVFLRVRSLDLSQTGPARIFTVSEDPWHRNITLGQDGDSLVVRLRTPGTDANGQPERVISKVFSDARWVEISLAIMPGRIRVEIDGRVALDDGLHDRPLEYFDATYRLALGNELTTNRPWLGEIKHATVVVGASRFDYMHPAQLQLPRRLQYFHNPPHLIPFRDMALADALLNLLGFVPLGVLFGWLTVQRKRGSTSRAIAGVLLVSLVIEAFQWWMPARFMSIDDLLLNTLGGVVGVFLARQLGRRVLRHRYLNDGENSHPAGPAG
jgi:hypothetical protein